VIINICDDNQPFTNESYAACCLRKAFSLMMAEQLWPERVGDYKLIVQ
jgi:hypothetical protein